jgi:putative peptide zinc metalloprotease protein
MTSTSHLSRAARAAIAALVGTVLLWATPPAHAAEDDRGNGSRTNIARAVNKHDGAREVRASFQVADVGGQTVDPANYALAFANCTDCQTYAVAFQVAFVHGTPQVFTPTNQAWAINYECLRCITVADAYQFVTSVPDGSSLTREGQRQLRALRREVGGMKSSSLSPYELHDESEAVAAQVRDVLATGIAHTGQVEHEGDDRQHEEQATTPGAPAPETVPASAETTPADTAPSQAPATAPAA